MNQHINTPIKRLEQLEAQVVSLTNQALKTDLKETSTTKNNSPIWNADEQLLLTCLRRFNPVMDVYIRQGLIQMDSQNNINLVASDQSSFYKFIVLQNGNAVVWGDFKDFDELEGRRELINHLYALDNKKSFPFGIRYITKLAYFVPIETGKRWAFSQKGIIQGEHNICRGNDRFEQGNRDIFIKKLEAKVYEQTKEINYLKVEIEKTRNEIKEILHLLLHSR